MTTRNHNNRSEKMKGHMPYKDDEAVQKGEKDAGHQGGHKGSSWRSVRPATASEEAPNHSNQGKVAEQAKHG